MKTIFLVFSFTFSIFTQNLHSQNTDFGFTNNFYAGIIDNGRRSTSGGYNWSTFSDLHLNLWMHYALWGEGGYPDWPNGWTDWVSNDMLTNTQYQQGIINLLSTVNSSGFRTVGERIKIARLCYGQRSNYQAEKTALCDPYYDFYSFETSLDNNIYAHDIQDNSSHGYGQWVKHCWNIPELQPGTPVTILKDLKANREQADNDFYYHPYQMDQYHNFFIKPKIRIPTNLPDGMQVCRIKVYSWDGTTVIKDVILKASNFKVDENETYNGEYIEEYNFTHDPAGVNFVIDNLADGYNHFNPPPVHNIWGNCNVDIEVQWLANCDMWLDYVRVDDDIADGLMNPNSPNFNTFNQWLYWEAHDIPAASSYNQLKFYIEEFQFDNIPCIQYVNRKLREYSGNRYSMMCDMNGPELFRIHRRDLGNGFTLTPDYVKRTLLDSAELDNFFTFCYPIEGYIQNTPFNNPSYIPTTLPSSDYSIAWGRFREPRSPDDYDNWLQTHFDEIDPDWLSLSNTHFITRMKLADGVSKASEKPFVNMLQTHLWYSVHNNQVVDVAGEPTNEEMEMMANVSLTYGARAELWFAWSSWGALNDPNGFGFGLANPGVYTPRENNVYDQMSQTQTRSKSKITTVSRINDLLTTPGKWGAYLTSFDNANRHSYIYHLDYSNVNQSTIFYDIQTWKPDQGDEIADGYPQRYVQAATFYKPSERQSKFFMLVNRRCSPYRPENNQNGGRRHFKVRFDANHLPTYASWKLYNLENNSLVASFSKNGNPVIDLGWYMPAEGRLYKLVPVIISGGELQDDENVSGENFTVEDTVWNNGHNITIGNTTISFTDTSKIIMDGGTFQIGEQYDNASGVTSKAVTGNHWFGYDFNNCTVKVYNSHFQNLANDTTYALNIINCPYIDIRDNTFSFENDALKGGINVTYFSSGIPFSIQNLYIGYNSFNSNNSTVPLLSVMSYAGITTPALLEHNTFTTNNTSGSTAIMLNEIVGGAVKSNVIANFELGINALASSIDIYGNLIASTVANSVGISGLAGSELKLNPTSGIYLGGMNNVSNTGSNNKNINVKNSYFLLDGGKNVFNIVNSGSNYHLAGYFPQNGSISLYETENCFKFSGNQTQSPAYSVTDYSGNPLTLQFFPFNCDNDSSCFAGDLGVGDTVWQECGQGGAFSNVVVVTPKTIHDSLCLEMRKRNYLAAVTKAMALLNLFPDSLLSLDAVSKLYLAKTRTDTSTASNTALKIFYETLILNHPTNTSLVRRCNYFVQKCKVLLRQYSSAMTGFQQIMEQNPYSYDALVAHWDYMATELLMRGGGGGGGESSDDDDDSPLLGGVSRSDGVGDDKSPFTREQKKQISETVTNTYKETNNQEEKKIEVLKELSKNGDVKAERELVEKNALKEAAKQLHPRNIQEHINIVNGDVQKLFAVNKSDGSNGSYNLIPNEFSLSQNYPNPFNPVTKIKYALPRDVKVSIKIYDILGREVKTLLNEFKKAGYYEENFDGSNLATGVYFYRLEAGEFVQSKKMVLLK